MKATHLLAALVAAGAACTALTGCGGDEDSADSAPLVRSVATTTTTTPAAPAAADPFPGETGEGVMREAEKAMRAETSMTMDLRTVEDDEELHVRAALTKDGRCAATVSDDGASFQVVSVSKKYWMKADEAFWKAHGGAKGESVAKLMSGKWLKLPADGDDNGFAEFCSLSSFLDEMFSDDGSPVVKGGVTTDAGHLVVPLTSHDDEEDLDTVVEVAAQGPHRILKAYSPDDDSDLATFTDFGKKFSINPPPARQVVDISALGDPDFSI